MARQLCFADGSGRPWNGTLLDIVFDVGCGLSGLRFGPEHIDTGGKEATQQPWTQP